MTRRVSGSAAQPVALFDPDGNVVEVDPTAGALRTITVEHHEIHEGLAFIASYKSPEGGDIGDNNSLDLLLFTGPVYTHIVAKPAAGGDAEFLIYETPTVTNHGTGLTEVNRNRASSNIATGQAWHTPTVGAVGTQLVQSLLPGGTGGNAGGGLDSDRFEFVLKPITYYLFRLTNRAGSAKPLSIVLDWYEH